MMPTPSYLKPLLVRLKAGTIVYKDRLEHRIIELSVAFAEDYDDYRLSTRAFAGLVDYLESSPSFGYPDVTATPDGGPYAEWRGSQGRLLTIEFLESGTARYLLFRPNPKHPQIIDRLAGTTTTDALPETIASLSLSTGLAA